jgi:hypothetical protein
VEVIYSTHPAILCRAQPLLSSLSPIMSHQYGPLPGVYSSLTGYRSLVTGRSTTRLIVISNASSDGVDNARLSSVPEMVELSCSGRECAHLDLQHSQDYASLYGGCDCCKPSAPALTKPARFRCNNPGPSILERQLNAHPATHLHTHLHRRMQPAPAR